MTGRAARNAAGLVIFYAERITPSMQRAIAETDRRRQIQEAYNQEHGIVPKTIYRTREEIMQATSVLERANHQPESLAAERAATDYGEAENLVDLISELEKQMRGAAARLDFETAAALRDEVGRLRQQQASAQ